MSSEERKATRKVKLEISPEEDVITYKRRRIMKADSDCSESLQQEDKDTEFTNQDTEKAGIFVDSPWYNWKLILGNILKLPALGESGGIQSCIQEAIQNGPFGFTQKLQNGSVGQSEEKIQLLLTKCSQNNSNSSSNSNGNNSNNNCQNALLEILVSKNFVLLCDLLSRNFQENGFNGFTDFGLIDKRMKNGYYCKFPRSFVQDLQLIWDKFRKIGQEMVLLATSLSSISRASYQKQVGEISGLGPIEQNPEEICVLNTEICPVCPSYMNNNENNTNNINFNINSGESDTTTQQLTVSNSDRSNSVHPDQTDTTTTGPHKKPNCKLCNTASSVSDSLICDGCELTYHLRCINLSVEEIPPQNWYCNFCTSADKKPNLLHPNCSVCDRLEITRMPSREQQQRVKDEQRDEEELTETNEPVPPRPPLLCKVCGLREEQDKRFLVCGHLYCPYKYYHIRCLKSSQIAGPQQVSRGCWYCPSCLCRVCYLDRDDDSIVLCDRCDEAYHIYCMDPVRESVPEGQWFCVKCSLERAKEGMRKYEESVLKHHFK